jgi:hypothetical protein
MGLKFQAFSAEKIRTYYSAVKTQFTEHTKINFSTLHEKERFEL